MACIPTVVFQMEWPDWVKEEVLKTNSGRGGTLANSDLEMAGLLLLFLVMEEVCDMQPGGHVALFSDNSSGGSAIYCGLCV
jgi:predicted outer membrane repeat protein